MNFTDEDYEKAKQADLLQYLQNQGYELIRAGNDYRLKDHDSLVIHNNMWKWFSRDIGGTNIQFLTKYEGKNFCEAVCILSGKHAAFNYALGVYRDEAPAKADRSLELPARAGNCRRILDYLVNRRGLDIGIVQDLIGQGKVYQSGEYGNCVFVGFDPAGQARYATARGTFEGPGIKQYKKDVAGSDKSYGFLMEGRSRTVYVFESAIDAISHATLYKLKGLDYTHDTRLSLGGVASLALDRFLAGHEVNKIAFCLDNDEAGRHNALKMMEQYLKAEYEVCYLPPEMKDYNDDLVFFKQEFCEEMER